MEMIFVFRNLLVISVTSFTVSGLTFISKLTFMFMSLDVYDGVIENMPEVQVIWRPKSALGKKVVAQ